MRDYGAGLSKCGIPNWNAPATSGFKKTVGTDDTYLGGNAAAKLLGRVESAFYTACTERKLLGVANPHEDDYVRTGGRLPRQTRDHLLTNSDFGTYQEDTGCVSPMTLVTAAYPPGALLRLDAAL